MTSHTFLDSLHKVAHLPLTNYFKQNSSKKYFKYKMP